MRITIKGITSSLRLRLIGLILISIAFFASTSLAQTTVCSGDSVVLVLDGYKQGITAWEQSLDQTNWSNVSGNTYNDSLLIVATSTLYYRATVTDSTCSSPFYSDTVMIVVNRTPPPIAKTSTDRVPISFTANWKASVDTTTYYLDVATDAGFTSFVPGYNKLNVANDTTYSVYSLSCNTPYYYRVRAYNSCGGVSDNSNVIAVSASVCPIYCAYKSACSGNIIDTRDNKTYKTVQIGSQCWMAQNLNVGTAIPVEASPTPGIIEKYCYGYDHSNTDSSKCAMYGGLYEWDHMMAYDTSRINAPGPRGICPTGWHIPTDNEWKCLEMNLGMSLTDADVTGPRGETEGDKLKTKGNGAPPLWASPSAGTDITGFSALPGGARFYPNTVAFYGFGSSAYFWTASDYNVYDAWSRNLTMVSAKVTRPDGSNQKVESGYSVRCVKD